MSLSQLVWTSAVAALAFGGLNAALGFPVDPLALGLSIGLLVSVFYMWARE